MTWRSGREVPQLCWIANHVEGDDLFPLDLERSRLDAVLRVQDEARQSIDRRALQLLPAEEAAIGGDGREQVRMVCLPRTGSSTAARFPPPSA